jgi:hypothetical protein
VTRMPLAPLEWPSSRALPEVRGTSLATMLEHPKRVRKILRDALDENYLPHGVLLMLAAEVTPLSADLKVENKGLDKASSGLIASGFQHLAGLMASAIAWNKEHQRSFFQRLSQYTGSHASVAVFRRRPANRIEGTVFHVAEFAFQAPESAPAMLALDARYDRLVLPADDEPQERGSDPGELELSLSTDDAQFVTFSRQIRDDRPYLSHVASFIPYANLVLAAPRVFYGEADFQRRLGSLGLNVLFHPDVEIDRELVTRVYLLADRLNAMFHLSTAAHLDGRLSGASQAFGIVEHSLKNARFHRRTGDERLDAVLDTELLNVRGARSLLTGATTTDLFTPKTASTLATALSHYGDGSSFSLDVTALIGRTVSHAFVSILIEIARNQQKDGKTGGLLEVRLSGDESATIFASTTCTCAEAKNLREAVSRGMPRSDNVTLEGMQALLVLCDFISTSGSVISFEVDEPLPGQEAAGNCLLPSHGTVVSCRFGIQLAMMLRASEDNDVKFISRTEISGLRLS